MLSQLSITNFGLIDKVSLDFSQRLNILTGETGAGKSILIDALRIALGERFHAPQMRDKDKPCVIEAVFSIETKDLRALAIFEDFLEEENELIIQRKFTPDGKNKNKINGASVTISQLKELGDYLVDFHGPHDHQRLLSSDFHLSMLDRLVKFEKSQDQYRSLYSEFTQLRKKIKDLQNLAQSSEREMDLLNHQVKELSQVSFKESEYKELLQEQAKIDNAERLNDSVRELIQLLGGDENGTTENIRKSFSSMRTLNQIDESTAPLSELLGQFQEINDQLVSELKSYAEDIIFSKEIADDINDKVDIYIDILRKYGPSLSDAEKYYEQSKEKLDTIINSEHTDAEMRKELKAIEKKLTKCAEEITEKRKTTATQLIKTVEKELKELGIPQVKFDVKFEKVDFSSNGWDQVVFYISPNTGVELKPLAEIVSSGEAARVMLALKKALIKVDSIDVLIFDEIDSQIGGRLGMITGQKLKEISFSRQVILITHLPQIACFADAHFKVIKSVKNKRSTTEVGLLIKEQVVSELAKMMSGEKESDIALKHANDLLAKAVL